MRYLCVLNRWWILLDKNKSILKNVFLIRISKLKFIFIITVVFVLDLLFTVGESTAGKASRSLAQHIPGPGGMEGMKGAASGVVGELARARIALDERGQKLGELEERTAAMMASADSFSKHAHDVSSLLK